MSDDRPAGSACCVRTGCLEDTSKRVRDRAYFLWEAAGCPQGREHEFWAKAALEVEGETREAPDRIVAR